MKSSSPSPSSSSRQQTPVAGQYKDSLRSKAPHAVESSSTVQPNNTTRAIANNSYQARRTQKRRIPDDETLVCDDLGHSPLSSTTKRRTEDLYSRGRTANPGMSANIQPLITNRYANAKAPPAMSVLATPIKASHIRGYSLRAIDKDEVPNSKSHAVTPVKSPNIPPSVHSYTRTLPPFKSVVTPTRSHQYPLRSNAYGMEEVPNLKNHAVTPILNPITHALANSYVNVPSKPNATTTPTKGGHHDNYLRAVNRQLDEIPNSKSPAVTTPHRQRLVNPYAACPPNAFLPSTISRGNPWTDFEHFFDSIPDDVLVRETESNCSSTPQPSTYHNLSPIMKNCHNPYYVKPTVCDLHAANPPHGHSSHGPFRATRRAKGRNDWEDEFERCFDSVPDDVLLGAVPMDFPNMISASKTLDTSHVSSIDNKRDNVAVTQSQDASTQDTSSLPEIEKACVNHCHDPENMHPEVESNVPDRRPRESRRVKGVVVEELDIPADLVFRVIFEEDVQNALIRMGLSPLEQSAFNLSGAQWTERSLRQLCKIWKTRMPRQKCQELKSVIFDSKLKILSFPPVPLFEAFALEFPKEVFQDRFFYDPSNSVHVDVYQRTRLLKSDFFGKPSVISATGMHQLQPSTIESEALFSVGRRQSEVQLFDFMIKRAVVHITNDAIVRECSLSKKITYLYTAKHLEQAPHRDFSRSLFRDSRRIPVLPWGLDMPLSPSGLLLNVWPKHELAQIASKKQAFNNETQLHRLPYTLDVSFRQVLLFSGQTVHGGGFQRRLLPSSGRRMTPADGCFRMHMYLSFAPPRRTHAALEGQNQVELLDDEKVRYSTYLLRSDGSPF